jgi:MFS family permease
MPWMPPSGRIAFMFGLFAVLFGTGQFHRVSTSIIMPELGVELALGAGALGAISGIYFLCAAAIQIPIGLCFDRFGARRTVPAILTVSCVGTVVFALSHSLPGLVIGRALMGIGFASVLMGAYAVFARWIPVERFSTVSAWMIAIGSIGGMIATSPLAAAIDWIGWRNAILAVGGLTVVLVILTLTGVRDAPAGYVDTGRRPSSLRDNLAGLWQAWQRRDMRLILAMGTATYGPGMALLGLWGGSYLADVYGLDALTRGHVLFAMALAPPLGLLVIGPLDRLFNSRKRVVLIFAGSKAAAFLWLALLADRGIWVVVPAMVWVMFAQAYYVVLQSHCRAIFPETMVGRATTSLNLVSVGGVALMQIVTGLIIDQFPASTGVATLTGYRWVFAAVGIAIVLAVVAYARIDDRPVSVQDG